jgi:hypothetical protein
MGLIFRKFIFLPVFSCSDRQGRPADGPLKNADQKIAAIIEGDSLARVAPTASLLEFGQALFGCRAL